MTRDTYEQRKRRLDEETTVVLQEFERAKNALGNLHKASLDLEAEWAVSQARANATPGMWPAGLNDELLVTASKILTEAGHTPAHIGGTDIRDCKDTGFFMPRRNRDEPVEVWHLVEGRNRTPNGVDAWYEQLDAYRHAFRHAGWRIERQGDVRSIRVTPPPAAPTDRTPRSTTDQGMRNP